MSTFSFTDRATYLAYRAQWKANYVALSQEIRSVKRYIREQYAAGRIPPNEQSERHFLAKQATAMLEDLKEAKLEAARQWAASREVANAA